MEKIPGRFAYILSGVAVAVLTVLWVVVGTRCQPKDQFAHFRKSYYLFLRQTRKPDEPPGPTGPPTIVVDRLLDRVLFPSGKVVEFTVDLGKGLFRRAEDPEWVYYAVTDRGPSLSCAESARLLDGKPLCPVGTAFVLPDVGPSIYRLRLDFEDETYDVEQVTPLLGRNGETISGMPNCAGDGQPAWSAFGASLNPDPEGLDPEAIVRLKDGTYWLAEEYGPSLVHVDFEGHVLARLVPRGHGTALASAPYPVAEVLPAVYRHRLPDMGLSALGLSPEGEELYALFERPLARPNVEAAHGSSHLRLLVLDPDRRRPTAEHVYVLDQPSDFGFESGEPTIVAMLALSRGNLLVMERLGGTARIFLVELVLASNILGDEWDDPERSPSLETADLAQSSVKPVSKSLVLQVTGENARGALLHGMALMGENTLVLGTASEWGLTGRKTLLRKINILDQDTQAP